MTTLKVTIANEDGIVIDQFRIESPLDDEGKASSAVIDYLGMKFELPDN